MDQSLSPVRDIQTASNFRRSSPNINHQFMQTVKHAKQNTIIPDDINNYNQLIGASLIDKSPNQREQLKKFGTTHGKILEKDYFGH